MIELQNKRAALQSKLNNLRKSYSEKHPEVVAVQSEIAAIDDALSKLQPTQTLANLKKQLAEEESRLADLRIRYSDDYKPIMASKEIIAFLKKQIAELLAQSPSNLNNTELNLLAEITRTRNELTLCGLRCDAQKQKLAELYRKAIDSPNVFNFLVGDAVLKYDGSKDSVRSAAQLSQLADEQNAELLRLIVLQNQKIIELLQKLVNKK